MTVRTLVAVLVDGESRHGSRGERRDRDDSRGQASRRREGQRSCSRAARRLTVRATAVVDSDSAARSGRARLRGHWSICTSTTSAPPACTPSADLPVGCCARMRPSGASRGSSATHDGHAATGSAASSSMAAAVRIGTCSWADDALSKHWYPPGTPPTGAPRLLRRALLDGRGRLDLLPRPDRADGARLGRAHARRVRDARQGVRADDPPSREARAGAARSARGPAGRRARPRRPPADARRAAPSSASSSTPCSRCATPGSSAGSSSSCRRTSSGSRRRSTTSSGRASSSAATRCSFEPRHRSWYAEDVRAELLRFLEERRMTWVVVDAPKVEAAQRPGNARRRDDSARLRPLPRPERRARGTSAAARPPSASTTSTARTSCASGCSRCASSSNAAEEVYAFFNNNNQTDGVAQAPAGAHLLRKLLDEEKRPDRLMRVLAVTHGPPVRPELFADVIAEEGHELLEWDIRLAGRASARASTPCWCSAATRTSARSYEHPWLHDEYDALRRWVARRDAAARRLPRRADAGARPRRDGHSEPARHWPASTTRS